MRARGQFEGTAILQLSGHGGGGSGWTEMNRVAGILGGRNTKIY